MAGFFKKMSTLIQSQINDIISPMTSDSKDSKSRRKFLSRQNISGALSNDVEVIRKRLNEALDYETELQAKTDTLYALIAQLDGQADQAVNEGRDSDARKAVSQLQQAQRDLQTNESHLFEHRLVTQELMSRLNALESVLEAGKTRVDAEEMLPQETARDSALPSENSAPITSKSVDDDLAQRRSRLMKPDSD